jgi:hypothetical protein
MNGLIGVDPNFLLALMFYSIFAPPLGFVIGRWVRGWAK